MSKLLNEQCIYIKLILNHAGFIHEIGCLLETFFVSVSDLCGEVIETVHLLYRVNIKVKCCGNSLHGCLLVISHVGCDLFLCSV